MSIPKALGVDDNEVAGGGGGGGDRLIKKSSKSKDSQDYLSQQFCLLPINAFAMTLGPASLILILKQLDHPSCRLLERLELATMRLLVVVVV